LLYLGRSAAGWQLMELSANGAATPLTRLGHQWQSLSAGQNQTVGLKAGDPYLYRLEDRNGEVTAVRTHIRRPTGAYAITTSGIVQIAGDRVVQTAWDGSQVELQRLPTGRGRPADIEVDKATGRILVLDRSGNEANIALMTLRRQ
jgi:hypothetical protein